MTAAQVLGAATVSTLIPYTHIHAWPACPAHPALPPACACPRAHDSQAVDLGPRGVANLGAPKGVDALGRDAWGGGWGVTVQEGAVRGTKDVVGVGWGQWQRHDEGEPGSQRPEGGAACSTRNRRGAAAGAVTGEPKA